MSLIAQLLKNPENKQKDLIQTTFALVVPIADKAAEIFYNKLFELDPNLKPLFKGDMKEQGKKLMTMIATAVKGLDKPASIIGAVEDLGKRHVGYGVKDAHYDTVGQALLYTLEVGLGSEWNSEVQEAWTTLYVDLSTTMKNAAATV